jgi:uncharacterized SAM-binding protein YcdF (DUF218 family)
LWSLGAILTENESPRPADIIVVIGGDDSGNRILKAAEMVRSGYAPKILVSGVGGIYGHHETDLAIDFAVAHGYPRGEFVPFYYAAVSTRDEAKADIAQIRRLGVRKYILVTSDFHTARARRTFRRESAGLEMSVVAAPDKDWDSGKWWKTREGRKLWFSEFVKTIADYLRI